MQWWARNNSDETPRWLRSRGVSRTQAATTVGLLGALLVLLSVAVWPSATRVPDDWEGTFWPDPAVEATGFTGAVASDVELCSEMGVDVLRRNGTAADAAVVVSLCLGSVSAQSSGIGGGTFITVRLPNGTAFVIDARETAPRAAHRDMFNADPLLSRVGGLASGVPGEVAGLERLWQLAGNHSWGSLVHSVADLNEIGFARPPYLARAAGEYREQMLAAEPELWHALYNASDWDWLYGDERPVVRRPSLARTLRTIADDGARAFYDPRGWIAQSLARITRETGGVLTPEDFGDYAAEVRPALHTSFRGRTVLTAPAPASGNALVMGLNALEHLLPANSTIDGEADPVYVQRTIEVMKWMAAARSELGDPGFVANAKMDEMLGPEWAARVAGNVSDTATLASWRDYHPSYEMNEPHGTSHFAVLDKDGMAVSMTTTVNLLFGNFVCDPVTGVIMNSEMDDFAVPNTRNSFDLVPSVYNFIEPGKRPLSSTVPSIVVGDAGVELVVGAAGGSRILTSVFQALTRRYAFDVPALETVAYPRLHHQLIPEKAELEFGWPDSVRRELVARGHTVEYGTAKSAMSLVHKDRDGMLHAVGDYYRKRGMGAAY